jgi:hypothetical protein
MDHDNQCPQPKHHKLTKALQSNTIIWKIDYYKIMDRLKLRNPKAQANPLILMWEVVPLKQLTISIMSQAIDLHLIWTIKSMNRSLLLNSQVSMITKSLTKRHIQSKMVWVLFQLWTIEPIKVREPIQLFLMAISNSKIPAITSRILKTGKMIMITIIKDLMIVCLEHQSESKVYTIFTMILKKTNLSNKLKISMHFQKTFLI